MKNFFLILVLITCALLNGGCSSFGKKFKSFLNGGDSSAQQKRVARPSNTFNSRPTYNAKIPNRQYKRVTKKSIEDSARLDSRAGSLWVMEGQGAYLFSQNIMRMIGDPLAVRIEGEPKQQLESKVNVIKKLMAKLEERRRKALRAPSSQKAASKKSGNAGAPPKPAAPKVAEKQEKADEAEFNVKTVPTRITERLVDGNYRVKGSQPFMIGKREYKAIVTGIVRAEDFTEEGISAAKLIDPKFDIVSVRKRVR